MISPALLQIFCESGISNSNESGITSQFDSRPIYKFSEWNATQQVYTAPLWPYTNKEVGNKSMLGTKCQHISCGTNQK